MIKTNLKQMVSQRISEALKKGVKPWTCPWTGSKEPFTPYNANTQVKYQGVNIFILWHHAAERGYTRNAWLTMKQCNAMGGRIIKGEKSVQGFFYQMIEKEVKEKGEDKIVNFPVLKHFNLFNIEQTDGIAPLDPVLFDTLDADGLNYAKRYLSNQSIPVHTHGNSAYYSSTMDRIHMPNAEFSSNEDYLATLFHEMVHSSGHLTRLSRFKRNENSIPDVKSRYAFEELCAELGAAILTAYFGFNGTHLQHESYIGSWIKHLDDNMNYFFKASSEASRAVNFIEKIVSETPVECNLLEVS